MKQKTVALLLCASLLAGCQAKAPPEHFAAQHGEKRIALDDPAEPILAALGPPFAYCVSTLRKEKTYRFSGLQLHTYPGKDGERVSGLMLTAPGACTQEGIAIGDTAQQVRACYGDDALSQNRCTIHRNNETLTLLLQNNRVSEIDYSLTFWK